MTCCSALYFNVYKKEFKNLEFDIFSKEFSSQPEFELLVVRVLDSNENYIYKIEFNEDVKKWVFVTD